MFFLHDAVKHREGDGNEEAQDAEPVGVEHTQTKESDEEAGVRRVANEAIKTGLYYHMAGVDRNIDREEPTERENGRPTTDPAPEDRSGAAVPEVESRESTAQQWPGRGRMQC